MTDNKNAAFGLIAIAGASLALAGCGGPAKQVADSRPAPRLPYVPPATTQPAPGQSSEAVWGLRAGLNVAALSCRGEGRRPVAGAYAAMLARHRALLAAAYRQEQGRQGKAFDRQQTRVYNTFANQASPSRFCSTASTVAQRANGLDSAAFAVAAPRLLGVLRASLH